MKALKTDQCRSTYFPKVSQHFDCNLMALSLMLFQAPCYQQMALFAYI